MQYGSSHPDPIAEFSEPDSSASAAYLAANLKRAKRSLKGIGRARVAVHSTTRRFSTGITLCLDDDSDDEE